MNKTWLNDEFWQDKVYQIEEAVALAPDGDCLIYPDGRFQFLGNYNNLDNYIKVGLDKSSLEKYLGNCGIILWLNISSDNKIIVPSQITDAQKQVITAIKYTVSKHSYKEGKTK